MKKVLVMGGTYFVGKRIVDELLKSNYDVYTLNRGSKKDTRVKNLICDRDNEEELKKVLYNHKFNIIIDVCGLTGDQAKKLCNSDNKDNLKVFVFISSSAVYDIENLSIPYKETDDLAENKIWTSYGKNKIEAEECYINEFKDSDVILIMVRPPYIYGEDNYAQRESFIFNHIYNEKPVIIPTSNPILQFIYTTDLADIIIKLVETSKENISIYNVGNRKSITSIDWVKACAKAAGKEVKIIKYDYKKDNRFVRDFFPFFDYDDVLDVSNINKIYSNETSFEEGLKNAYKWYLDNKSDIKFKENVTKNEEEILKKLGDQ